MHYGQNERAEILLVEDNPGDVRLTEEALRGGALAYRLSVAQDGVDALSFLRREGGYGGAPRPHLILLDLNMPRKNGLEVLNEIKHDPDLKRIPVIVLTTSQSERDIRAAYGLNANCYVSKPVDLHQFLEVVRRIELFWFGTVRLPDCPASPLI
jgi:CheY-like chemotaxis protein